MRCFIPFCCLLAVICSCSNSGNKPKSKPSSTEIFGNYLQKQFQKSIPEELHFFVVISRNTCVGCRSNGLEEFSKFSNLPCVTLVTSVTEEERRKWLNKNPNSEILIDSAGTLDRLNLPLPSNAAIIQTRHGEIIKINNFDYLNYELVFKSVFQNSDSILIY